MEDKKEKPKREQELELELIKLKNRLEIIKALTMMPL